MNDFVKDIFWILIFIFCLILLMFGLPNIFTKVNTDCWSNQLEDKPMERLDNYSCYELNMIIVSNAVNPIKAERYCRKDKLREINYDDWDIKEYLKEYCINFEDKE